jgi:hypothetical protein
MKIIIVFILSLLLFGFTYQVTTNKAEEAPNYATLIILNYSWGKADVFIVYDDSTSVDLVKQMNINIRGSVFEAKNFKQVSSILKMMNKKGYKVISHAISEDEYDARISYLFQK